MSQKGTLAAIVIRLTATTTARGDGGGPEDDGKAAILGRLKADLQALRPQQVKPYRDLYPYQL